MIEDRIRFRRTRRLLDALAGPEILDTLVLHIPDLLRVQPAHFRGNLDIQSARQLFASSVRYIEVETHSYCNRVCWFCPNSHIDRHSHREYLPEAAYMNLLRDLEAIAYRGAFSFSHYNEPFGDDIIYKRIRQTRESLPRAALRANSNGDFLNPSVIRKAADAGLNKLTISCYFKADYEWTRTRAVAAFSRIADRCDLKLHKMSENPNNSLVCHAGYGNMRIVFFCPNFHSMGIDRGGTIEGMPVRDTARTSPCLYAVTDMSVDYRGQVMPCCQLRSDVEAHKHLALGRITDEPGSIFRIYSSQAAAAWRAQMVRYGEKSNPCHKCRAREWADTGLLRRIHHHCLDRRASRALPTVSVCSH